MAPPIAWTTRAAIRLPVPGSHPAGGAGQREDCHADQEQPAAAMQIDKPARGHQQRRIKDRVGVQNP
jgi:hypothetical protein